VTINLDRFIGRPHARFTALPQARMTWASHTVLSRPQEDAHGALHSAIAIPFGRKRPTALWPPSPIGQAMLFRAELAVLCTAPQQCLSV